MVIWKHQKPFLFIFILLSTESARSRFPLEAQSELFSPNIHVSRRHVKQPNLKNRPLVISVSKTTINKNNSASSTTRWRRRGDQCSPLQHIRGVPALVALKVPVYKVIGLRVFNSGREADLKPPPLPSAWTAAD